MNLDFSRPLFIDTETTGIPIWDRRSNHPGQPRIIQLAAILTDSEGKKLSVLDTLIKPDGWVVPANITELTGLTTARCAAGGVPMNRALSILMALWALSTVRVSHGQAFDTRMVRIEIMRSDLPWATDTLADSYKAAPTFCTLHKSRPICKLPNNKAPKLGEAYRHFMGKEIEGAHDAYADAMAVKAVFFGIQAESGAEPTEPQSFVEPEPSVEKVDVGVFQETDPKP